MNEFDPTGQDVVTFISFEEELNIDDIVQYENIDDRYDEEYDDDSINKRMEPEEKDIEKVTGTDAARAPESFRIRPGRKLLSGRYTGKKGNYRLTLRVDIDGKRPMKRISGDFFKTSGLTVSYYGSFIVNSPRIKLTFSEVIIEGFGTFTFRAFAPKLRIRIPRFSFFRPPGPAKVQFLSRGNRFCATYICNYKSKYFRTVQYEQDYVTGVTPFSSYNTGSLPSGGTGRDLTVSKAYGEAGIEMLNSGTWNEVPVAGAGANLKWSNAELHQAMEMQFSFWRDDPQWKVWLLAAQLHDMGPGLLGIMFDQAGKQRQGCATFHHGIGGSSADKLRDQLYCYVHELGHCFNLFHAFHKQYMDPPQPNRLDSLSWMNYPRYYRRADGTGGEAAFWNDFPFQFDTLEVIHLRHAFRNNVIFGGNPFGTGAALEDPQAFADPVENNSGLSLELEAPKSFAYGEPVVIEINLKLNDMRGKQVQSILHPNMGFVQIGIKKPGGEVRVYEPFIDHCMEPELTMFDSDKPAIYESAYIGYGKDGFYFDQTGYYQIRAAYFALDGSEIVSNTITILVRSPYNSTDEEVADLFFGEDQGKLLYLLGSDSEFLKKGCEAFDLMADKYPDHPLAVYPQFINGINKSRDFKSFSSGRKFKFRKAETSESINLLNKVVKVSEGTGGLDNITLNMAMRSIARCQKTEGDEKSAKTTVKRMVNIFRKKSLKPHVMKMIEDQASEI